MNILALGIKLELCRPYKACMVVFRVFVGASPYAHLCRPFPTNRDKSRLVLDKELRSTRISLP